MIAQDMGELRPMLGPRHQPDAPVASRMTLRARGVIYHKASACQVETLVAADTAAGDVLPDLQLRQLVRFAAERLKRAAERLAVPLMRVRAFAEADVETHNAAVPALAHIRLRFELESAACRGDLDRLLALAEPAIVSGAMRCSAGVSVSLEHLLSHETDM